MGETNLVDQKLTKALEAIKSSISEIDNITELRDIKDLANGFEQAWRGYYHSSGFGFDQMFLGWETKIRSERRMGELLPKMIKNGGTPESHDTTLHDLGITRTQSSRYQQLSKIMEETFDKEILKIKGSFIEPATKSILDLYKFQVRAEKAEEGKDIVVPNEVNLIKGSFLSAPIEDNSLDLILTDPPYPKEDLPLWKELGKFASQKLKPSKFLVAYTGSLYLPQVMDMLGEYLDYYWIFAMLFTESPIVSKVNVIQRWKPVLIFQKPPFKRIDNTLSDLLRGGEREKSLHEWQQGIWQSEYLLEKFSQKGDVVCDPMMGAGTFPYIAHKLGRKPIGIEINEDTFNIAKTRFKEVENGRT